MNQTRFIWFPQVNLGRRVPNPGVTLLSMLRDGGWRSLLYPLRLRPALFRCAPGVIH